MTGTAFFARGYDFRERSPVRSGYTGVMHSGQTNFPAAIKLAAAFSVVAALLALGAEAIGGISHTAVVLTVIVVGFGVSLLQTGRSCRADERHAPHRLTIVPLRHGVGHPVG